MSNEHTSLSNDTTILKHYIKDLSFENLCDFNNQNFSKNDVEFYDNFDALFKIYNDNSFSVLLKYSCDCKLVKKKKSIFILEIDYFGLFKKNNMSDSSHDNLVKEGCILLHPILKPIVEYITRTGAPINISLRDPDFNLVKS